MEQAIDVFLTRDDWRIKKFKSYLKFKMALNFTCFPGLPFSAGEVSSQILRFRAQLSFQTKQTLVSHSTNLLQLNNRKMICNFEHAV